jgi:hypothetical protein
MGLILNPYTGQKILTLHQSKTYVVFEKTYFRVNSKQNFCISNIKLHAIAVYNVGFVESNFSLDCF